MLTSEPRSNGEKIDKVLFLDSLQLFVTIDCVTAKVKADLYTAVKPKIRNRAACYIQGDHLSGKPGNVREFETCQGNVRDVVISQGNVREIILSWRSVPKLFITR